MKKYSVKYNAEIIKYEFGTVKALDCSRTFFAETEAEAFLQACSPEQIEFIKRTQDTWVCHCYIKNEIFFKKGRNPDDLAKALGFGKRLY